MTDEQIEKALECCSAGDRCHDECPYKRKFRDVYDCTTHLAKEALAFIQRKKEEIKTLRAKTDDFPFCARSGCEAVSDTCYKTCPHSIFNKIRIEAIREFAERVDGILDLFAKGLIKELELYDKFAELRRKMTEEQK